MLPTPTEWPQTRGGAKYSVSLAFVAMLSLGSIVVGFGFVAIGKPGALKYALLFALLFALIAAYSYVTRMRPRHHERDIMLTEHEGSPATELRYSGTSFAILVALTICMTAIFGVASVDYFFAGETIPASELAGALTGAAALFCASFVALVVLGNINRGRVVLSQRGIYHRGRAFESFMPWEVFAGAKAAYNGTPEVLVIAYSNAPWQKRQTSKVWKIDKLPPVPMIEIDCPNLAIEPSLVYHLVKFYVDNPSARGELGTDASIQRARVGSYQ
ncbi:MAG: hypothetical protein GEU97_21885 [Actinophytocola sp.]|nr:hypothetical protein [Actinophytocola sp.]